MTTKQEQRIVDRLSRPAKFRPICVFGVGYKQPFVLVQRDPEGLHISKYIGANNVEYFHNQISKGLMVDFDSLPERVKLK